MQSDVEFKNIAYHHRAPPLRAWTCQSPKWNFF